MDISFIIDNCKIENTKSKENFFLWLKAVDSFFENKNIADALKDKKSLCKMFYVRSNNGLSRQKYQQSKRFIEELQRFYNISEPIPSYGEALNSRETVSLYNSLDSLLDFIDMVGKQNLENYDPQRDLLIIKSVAILGWHELTLSEIASIKKASLKDNSSICKNPIDARSFRILTNLASSTGHRGIPSGRLQIYKSNDEYLFRSITANQTVTENHFSDALKRFNREAIKYSKIVEFSSLRKNALFISIAKEAPPKNLAHRIKEVFECETKNMYALATEYLLWHKNIYLG